MSGLSYQRWCPESQDSIGGSLHWETEPTSWVEVSLGYTASSFLKKKNRSRERLLEKTFSCNVHVHWEINKYCIFASNPFRSLWVWEKKITFIVFNVFLQLFQLKLVRQLLSVEVMVNGNLNSSSTMTHQEAWERSGVFWVVLATLNIARLEWGARNTECSSVSVIFPQLNVTSPLMRLSCRESLRAEHQGQVLVITFLYG